jgi:hypothetical protein
MRIEIELRDPRKCSGCPMFNKGVAARERCLKGYRPDTIDEIGNYMRPCDCIKENGK